MPWFWHTEPKTSISTASHEPRHDTQPAPPSSPSNSEPLPRERDIIDSLKDPQNLIATLLLTSAILGATRLYKNQLRRIPTTAHLKPSQFTSSTSGAEVPLRRSSSLLGHVTSTHDPDNCRFFHTPGGRLLFWGTPLRPVPTSRAGLKDQTLSVRIAGIDAPELAHFGKPAQPYGEEALEMLKSLIEGQRARIRPLRRDQYERIVCLLFVRRRLMIWGEGWIHGLKEEGVTNFWRKDVGLEMIRQGAATVYEGRYGAEFGGAAREKRYREEEKEAKGKRLGMWRGTSKSGVSRLAKGGQSVFSKVMVWLGMREQHKKDVTFESPREYKQRMAKADKEISDAKKAGR